MSSPIARLLLRAYPSEFREEYGSEVLQLIEDRWRDEMGSWRRVRLCLDLGADLFLTQWRARRVVQTVPQASGGAGVLFHAFARDTEAGTMLPGMILSLLMVMAFVRVITPEGDRDLGMLLQTFSDVLRGV